MVQPDSPSIKATINAIDVCILINRRTSSLNNFNCQSLRWLSKITSTPGIHAWIEQFSSGSQAWCYAQSTLDYHSSSSLMFNVTRMQSIKDHTLITALRQCWTVSSCRSPPFILIISIIFDYPNLFMPTFTHTRSTSFKLSPYFLSPQPVIPCML